MHNKLKTLVQRLYSRPKNPRNCYLLVKIKREYWFNEGDWSSAWYDAETSDADDGHPQQLEHWFIRPHVDHCRVRSVEQPSHNNHHMHECNYFHKNTQFRQSWLSTQTMGDGSTVQLQLQRLEKIHYTLHRCVTQIKITGGETVVHSENPTKPPTGEGVEDDNAKYIPPTPTRLKCRVESRRRCERNRPQSSPSLQFPVLLTYWDWWQVTK